MLKLNRGLAIPTALILIVAIYFSVSAFAASGFSVSLVLPENQRPTGSAFFDLLVSPGQEQDLVIRITNSSDIDADMRVDVITASTSIHGEINYSDRGGLMDETLQFSLEDLMQWPLEPVRVPAGETVEVPIRLSVPMEPFDGILLGAINVVREVTQEERDAAGAIVNQFGFITAVRLVQSENADNIPADFVLGDVEAKLTNGRASVVAQIRNVQPRFIRGASASMEIFAQGSRTPVIIYEMQRLEMAPNSIFQYSFVDHDGRGVQAGDYTAIITLTYEDRTWSWEQDFTITPETAAEINEGAVNIFEPNGEWWEDIPLWAIIIMAALVIFIITVVLIIIMMARTAKANRRANEQLLKLANMENRQPARGQPTRPQPARTRYAKVRATRAKPTDARPVENVEKDAKTENNDLKKLLKDIDPDELLKILEQLRDSKESND